jgi:hypothetical protein
MHRRSGETGLMVRDARLCRAPHHEGLASCRWLEPRPEERACARLEGRATQRKTTRPLVLAAHRVRVFSSILPLETEGAGKTGCPSHPWSACSKKHAAEPQVRTEQPAFPAQWCSGLYVISPVTRLCCHRRRSIIAEQLDASLGAPGPHDFAVRAMLFVLRHAASIASRCQRP